MAICLNALYNLPTNHFLVSFHNAECCPDLQYVKIVRVVERLYYIGEYKYIFDANTRFADQIEI